MSKFDVNETVKELEEGTLPEWITKHQKLYVESGGKEGHEWDSTFAGGKGLTPCLLLTTLGRRSQQKRQVPLIYGRDGDALVVIGSKGGAETHTAWYWNIVAEPNVEVQVGTEQLNARARVAEGAERERLWAMMVDVYPPYTDYQASTTREIPVVVLDRR